MGQTISIAEAIIISVITILLYAFVKTLIQSKSKSK
jgi:hypothetical protein